MTDPIFLQPADGDDPCGPDMRWDGEFLQLSQALEAAATSSAEAVVEGDLAGAETPDLEAVLDLAKSLSARSKDMRILALYAEARWRDAGLAAFAESMEELACVVETWPGGDDGVHPRADEDDGDLGERAAPLGKLLNLVPGLASTIGWGDAPIGADERLAAVELLKGVFEKWSERLEPALGPELPSRSDAWQAISKLFGDLVAAEGAQGDAAGQAISAAVDAAPMADAWDLVERAAERMEEQNRHSPVVPLLRLVSAWRSLDLIEIADAMRTSGVSLEQLLESIKRQRETNV